jgi:hypothetical protein
MAVAREGHPHLSPGREPGAQSRRTSSARTLGGWTAAFIVAGVVAAGMVTGFGVLLGSLPGGPSSWPFFIGAAGVLAFFWLFARTLARGARPRHATGLELRPGGRTSVFPPPQGVGPTFELPAGLWGPGQRGLVERQELRRGERVAAAVSGEGEVEVGLVCTEAFDALRRIGFRLGLPEDALPQIATAHARIGWEVRAHVDRAGAGPHRRPAGRTAPGLHCPGPGEVAEWLKALAC